MAISQRQGSNGTGERGRRVDAIDIAPHARVPAIACVGDAGYGEIVLHVAVNPKLNGQQWIRAGNPGFDAGTAFAVGWLERRKGKWLRTTGGPICAFRRHILPIIVRTNVVP